MDWKEPPQYTLAVGVRSEVVEPESLITAPAKKKESVLPDPE